MKHLTIIKHLKEEYKKATPRERAPETVICLNWKELKENLQPGIAAKEAFARWMGKTTTDKSAKIIVMQNGFSFGSITLMKKLISKLK